MVIDRVQGAKDLALVKKMEEEKWEGLKNLIVHNWDHLTEIGKLSGTTGSNLALSHTARDEGGRGQDIRFESDYIDFTPEQVRHKGSRGDPGYDGLQSYGVHIENLYRVTDSGGAVHYLLMYDRAPDGSIRIYRMPEEHPNYAKSLEKARIETEVANLDAFETIMTGAPAEETRISGAGRFAENAPHIARDAAALSAVGRLTSEQAAYFVEKARAEHEGEDMKIGSVVLEDGSRSPVMLAEVIEESFVGTGFESVKDDAADILAAKALGLVRASIAEKRREPSGENVFDIDHDGKLYRGVKLPRAALKAEGDIFIPLEYLEGFPSD
ncbi:MAG: hypothetical protein JXA24_08035 [Proteobacteria bacterium]|nr:hypothetical protein [Pseudomonadota bacterium]